MPVECVNGCCYGKLKTKSEHKGDYIKLCGSRFWALISGDDKTYLNIVEPLGHEAKDRNTEFLAQYELVVDEFTDFFAPYFATMKTTSFGENLPNSVLARRLAKKLRTKSKTNHKLGSRTLQQVHPDFAQTHRTFCFVIELNGEPPGSPIFDAFGNGTAFDIMLILD